jgi:hypothetical protein
MTTTPVMKMFTIDCADPRVLATFWSELLGWQIAHVEDEYAMLTASARPCRRSSRAKAGVWSSTRPVTRSASPAPPTGSHDLD